MGCKNCWDIFERHIAAGNVEHGAGEVTHHVVKESVAAHSVDEQSKAVDDLFVPRRGVDGADGGACFNPIDKDPSLGTPWLDLNWGTFDGVVRAGGEIGVGGGKLRKSCSPRKAAAAALRPARFTGHEKG
jgi:hypothetical protein